MTVGELHGSYDAFISYSHAVDEQLGPALRDALHRFARPWHRRRSLRVFCDRQSLAANEGLWPTLEEALSASRTFILLASPASAASVWVSREVETWRSFQPRRPLLVVLTAGLLVWDAQAGDVDWEKTTALPRALDGWFSEEPLWVDLRALKTPADLSVLNPGFVDAVATLAAPLHGRSKDDLIGEDVRQHRRARLVRAITMAALSALTVLAVVSALVARDQRQEALAQRDRAVARYLVLRAEALRPSDPAVSALLTVAAWRRSDNPDTRSSLLGLQARHVAVAMSGHAGDAYGVAVSPTGDLFASTGQDGSVRLWDIHGRPVATLPEQARGFSYGPAFSDDGAVLANATLDGTIEFWDVRRRLALPFPGLNTAGAVAGRQRGRVMALGSRGAVVATSSPGNAVTLWHRDGSPPEVGFRMPGPIRAMAFSPGGKALAVADDTTVQLWDVAAKSRVGAAVAVTVPRIPGGPALCFSRDGATLAVADDRDVKLLDTADGHVIGVVRTPHRIRAVALSPDGSMVASAGRDDAVRVWDLATHRQVGDGLAGHGGDVWSIAFTPRGDALVAAGRAGRLSRWQLDDSVVGHQDGAVAAVAVTPDGRTLASVAADGSLRLWDLARAGPKLAPAVVARLNLKTGYQRQPIPPAHALFSPDGRMLAVSTAGGQVWLWRRDRDPRPTPLTTTPVASPPTLAFSADGRTLATTGGDHSVSLWDTSTGRRLFTLRAADHWAIAALTFTPDGRHLVTGANTLNVWDLSTRQPRSVAIGEKGHGHYARAVAVSADGSRLAVGDEDGTVSLWDVPLPGKPFAVVEGHRAPVVQVQFLDAEHLVSASRDGAVLIRGIPSRGPDSSLAAPAGITGFSPAGGGRLVTGSLDGRLVRWTTRLPDIADAVCSLGSDPLTAADWSDLSAGLTYRDICPDR